VLSDFVNANNTWSFHSIFYIEPQIFGKNSKNITLVKIKKII
jgi:hypothetical protein